jgi:hypothetical protein
MRWEWAVGIILLIVLAPGVLAHKSPIIEYGKHGVWRSEYSFQPRQPVVNEPIRVTEKVSHFDGEIEGTVSMKFSIYQDSSVNNWYGGKEYRELHWTLIKSEEGLPYPGEENKFYTDVIIDRPGNYMVTVDLYENGQYIGQDIRAFDVEQRTIGPLYIAFSAVVILGVLYGVRQRIL